MRPVLRAFLLMLWAFMAMPSHAHEMTMAEMQLREINRGDFLMMWGPGEKRAPSDELSPVWPESCRAEGSMIHCGERGLSGLLQMDGIGKTFSAAMVKVYWLDGGVRVYTLTASQPTVHLFGSAEDKRGLGEIGSAYTMLGIEHILSGVDHLLFVISLLFLVGFNRRLLLTITAFTAAHSLTLALSALNILILRSPPVEASIALSIMLVAGEALHKRDTLARRWPALVAFLFGLVHGLGFAGALKEIGLPEQHLSIALLTFNIGVELGQLMVVSLAYLLYRFMVRWPQTTSTRAPALYVIGGIAAYWSIGRIAGLVVV